MNERDVKRYNELAEVVGADYDGSWWSGDTMEMAGLEAEAGECGRCFVLQGTGRYALETVSGEK